VGRGRSHTEDHQMIPREPFRLPKSFDVPVARVDQVVGGEDGDRGGTVALRDRLHPVVNGREGVLPLRLDQHDAVAPDLGELITDDEFVVLVGNNVDILRGREEERAFDRLLEERFLIEEFDELLWVMLAREWEEAGAASSRENECLHCTGTLRNFDG
jgi:hypothetical protein